MVNHWKCDSVAHVDVATDDIIDRQLFGVETDFIVAFSTLIRPAEEVPGQFAATVTVAALASAAVLAQSEPQVEKICCQAQTTSQRPVTLTTALSITPCSKISKQQIR